MVSSSCRFNIKSNDTDWILDTSQPKPIINSKCKICMVISFLMLCFSIALFVYIHIKIQSFNTELLQMKNELEKMQKGFMDDDLFADIRQFENDAIYPDDFMQDPIKLIDGNDFLDIDYDIDYDENNINLKTMPEEFPFHQSNNDYAQNINPKHTINEIINEEKFEIDSENKRTRRDLIASTREDNFIKSQSYNGIKADNESINEKKTKSESITEIKHGDEVDAVIPQHEAAYQSSSTISNLHSVPVLGNYQKLDANSESASVSSDNHQLSDIENKRHISRRQKRPQLSTEHQRKFIEDLNNNSEVTIVENNNNYRRNRHKQRQNIETLDERPSKPKHLVAIHLSGDASKYVVGHHTNYKGNGHLQHPKPTYIDWISNNWVKSLNMDQHFHINDGVLKIKEKGLYFVYAQIFYLDEHDTNGYRIYKNEETLLQCTVMTHSLTSVSKGNTCYTAGAEYLNEGDQLRIQDLADGRWTLFEQGKSFFGAIRLGDIKTRSI